MKTKQQIADTNNVTYFQVVHAIKELKSTASYVSIPGEKGIRAVYVPEEEQRIVQWIHDAPQRIAANREKFKQEGRVRGQEALKQHRDTVKADRKMMQEVKELLTDVRELLIHLQQPASTSPFVPLPNDNVNRSLTTHYSGARLVKTPNGEQR